MILPLGPTQPSWAKGGFSFGGKQLGRELKHSTSCSAEVKNAWSYTSTPPVCLHGIDRDNFTLTFHITVQPLIIAKNCFLTKKACRQAVHLFPSTT
jgi:hypothetical protein